MLPEAAASLVREVSAACGEALLLDAKRSRALLGEPGKLLDLCKGLRRGGFTRAVDFTAMHLGPVGVGLVPAQAPVGVGQSPHPVEEGADTAAPLQSQGGRGQAPPLQSQEDKVGRPMGGPYEGFAFFLALRAPKFGHCVLNLKWKWTLATVPHPSLSQIWPSCGLAEREMLEMLGLPFSGNDYLRPLLLDMRFQGYPLRRDFSAPPQEAYAETLLRDRHEAGLIFALNHATDTGGEDRRP